MAGFLLNFWQRIERGLKLGIDCIMVVDERQGCIRWPWYPEVQESPARMPNGEEWPKITIVTPSYKQSQFIEATVRSVLFQGYPNLEYVVIDGGSGENTIEIIQRYEEKLKFWVSEKDRGQCHAINKGFAQASGDIWGWVNSDDMLAEGALFKVATALWGKKRALLVGSAVEGDFLHGLEGRLDARKPLWREIECRGRTFPQPSVFWMKDLAECSALNGSLLDEGLHLALDIDLWLRMRPYVWDIIFLNDVLSYERQHAAQKTALKTYHAEQYIRERVFVCLRASLLRGNWPVFWWIYAWIYQLKADLRQGRYKAFGLSTLLQRSFMSALRSSMVLLLWGRGPAVGHLRSEWLR
jgi:glycosyltransferase involved in cell wall biosynthesis